MWTKKNIIKHSDEFSVLIEKILLRADINCICKTFILSTNTKSVEIFAELRISLAENLPEKVVAYLRLYIHSKLTQTLKIEPNELKLTIVVRRMEDLLMPHELGEVDLGRIAECVNSFKHTEVEGDFQETIPFIA